MAKMKTQISNYQEASAFLGGELERELGYRTVVHRIDWREAHPKVHSLLVDIAKDSVHPTTTSGLPWIDRFKLDSIAVRYIDTDIVIFHGDGDIEFDTGGWHTVTTKQRLSNIIPDVRVWSEGTDKWGFPIWAISAPEGADARFENGMYLRNNSFDHWKRNHYANNR